MIHRRQRNWGARLHETTVQGIPAIVLENELLRITMLTGKGTDLVEFNYKPRDLDFAWLTPEGVRSPAQMPTTAVDPVAEFIDTYAGGWQEIFPNGGEPSTYAGATHGQHGEVYKLPWDVEIVEDSAAAVAVRFMVVGQKTPCVIEKTVRLESGSSRLDIHERLTNESPVSFEAMWGQHITFGPPFMRPGCRIRVPDGMKVTPHPEATSDAGRRLGSAAPFSWSTGLDEHGAPIDFSIIPERGTLSELVYLSGFPDGTAWYQVDDDARRIGMRVEWDAAIFPHLWYWQEFGASREWPWWGRFYNIGLEPFSSIPTTGLADGVRSGTALTIEPGAPIDFWFAAEVVDAKESNHHDRSYGS